MAHGQRTCGYAWLSATVPADVEGLRSGSGESCTQRARCAIVRPKTRFIPPGRNLGATWASTGSMPKPTLEFTPISQFSLTKGANSQSADHRILSEDLDTGDKTMILTHPPGQEWGGSGGKDSQAQHTYWEVGFIFMDSKYTERYSGSSDSSWPYIRQVA